MFHCLVIKVLAVVGWFLISAATLKYYHRLLCLSITFFISFYQLFPYNLQQLLYNIISSLPCQQLFLLFLLPNSNFDILPYLTIYCQGFFITILVKTGEGGIWTLAPRKRPIPLAGAPLQPLEYFSKCLTKIIICAPNSVTHMLLYLLKTLLSIIFNKIFHNIFHNSFAAVFGINPQLHYAQF